jgi:hypothetical protein
MEEPAKTQAISELVRFPTLQSQQRIDKNLANLCHPISWQNPKLVSWVQWSFSS